MPGVWPGLTRARRMIEGLAARVAGATEGSDVLVFPRGLGALIEASTGKTEIGSTALCATLADIGTGKQHAY